MSSKLNVKLPDFLHVQDDEVRMVGHRLSIVDILAPYRDGYTPEMLAARYDTISLALIHYVIGFYHENQIPVDSYLNEYLAECDRLRQLAEASPEHQRLRERLLSMRRAQRKGAHFG